MALKWPEFVNPAGLCVLVLIKQPVYLLLVYGVVMVSAKVRSRFRQPEHSEDGGFDSSAKQGFVHPHLEPVFGLHVQHSPP